MVGQLIHTIVGPVFSGLGLPPISQDIVDVVAAQMPGLEHYLDPAKLKPAGEISRSKGDGRLIRWPTTAPITVGTVAGKYNGRPVLRCVGGGTVGTVSGLDIGPGGLLSTSFTFVTVCDMAAAMRDGTTDGYLFSAYNPQTAQFQHNVRFFGNATKGIACRPGGAGGGANLALSAAPAADTPFVLSYSYDATLNQSRVYINTASAPAASGDTNTPPVPNSLMTMGVGYALGQTATAWKGNIGKTMLFGRSYHTESVDLALLERLMTSMRTHYGIVV